MATVTIPMILLTRWDMLFGHRCHKNSIFFNFSVDPIHSPNSQQQTMELVTSSPYAYKEKKKKSREEFTFNVTILTMVHQTFHGDQSFHNTSCLTVFSGHIRHNVSVSPHNRPAWPLNRHGLEPTCIPIGICTTVLDAILFFNVIPLFPDPQKKEKTASFSPCIFFMVITLPTNNPMLNKMISSFCRYTPLPYSAHRNRHITHLDRSPWDTILMWTHVIWTNPVWSQNISEHPQHDLESALMLPYWIVRCCTSFLSRTIWSLLRAFAFLPLFILSQQLFRLECRVALIFPVWLIPLVQPVFPVFQVCYDVFVRSVAPVHDTSGQSTNMHPPS